MHYRNLNDSYLEKELGIRYLDTGIDEFVANDRKMRKGEVGAFLHLEKGESYFLLVSTSEPT